MSLGLNSARRAAYETRRTNHTLLGLDNILDKYQRENKLLAQQVQKLKQEKNKLHSANYAKEKEDFLPTSYTPLKSKWRDNERRPLSRNMQRKNYEEKKCYNYYEQQLGYPLQTQKTKRKEYDNCQKIACRPKKNISPYQNQRTKTEPILKTLNCNVYMQEETFDYGEQKLQNLGFDEPSFGKKQIAKDIYLKEQQQSIVQQLIQIDKQNMKIQKKQPQKKEKQKQKIFDRKNKVDKFQIDFSNIRNEMDKQLCQEKPKNDKKIKKNNIPYIGYKLAEPKNQLRKYHNRTERVQTQTIFEANLSNPKKSYLSILSKQIGAFKR